MQPSIRPCILSGPCGTVESVPGVGEDAHTTAGQETGATPYVFIYLGVPKTHGDTAEVAPSQNSEFFCGLTSSVRR